MKGVLHAAKIDDINVKNNSLEARGGTSPHERKTKKNSNITGVTPSATATTNLFPVFTTVRVSENDILCLI